jgi:GTPase involved in cell partitioning and DNA repair
MADQTKATKALVQEFSDQLAEEIDTVLHKKLDGLMSVQFEQLRKAIDEQNKLLTMILEGFNEDRKDISQTRVEQAGIRQTLFELLEASSRQTKVITGKVTFEVEKLIDTIPDRAREGIQKYAERKHPDIEPKQKKRSWNPLKLFQKK